MHEQGHKHIAEPGLDDIRDPPVHSSDREHVHRPPVCAFQHPPPLRLVRLGEDGESPGLQEAVLRRLPGERREAVEGEPDHPVHLLQFLHVPSCLQVC